MYDMYGYDTGRGRQTTRVDMHTSPCHRRDKSVSKGVRFQVCEEALRGV